MRTKKINKWRHHLHFRRFIIVSCIMAIVFVGLFYRLFYLEAVDNQFLKEKGKNESNQTINLQGERGVIYDRNGTPLAISTLLYNIILDIKVLKKYPHKYRQLDSIHLHNLSVSAIEQLIQKYPNKRYYIAAKFVKPAEIEKLRNLNIPGVHIAQNSRTYYPMANAIAPVIGFNNSHNQGQAGLLLSYNHYLNTSSAEIVVKTNAKGELSTLPKLPEVFAKPKSLILTIDYNIQYFAYHALKSGVINAKADSGAAVVIDPKTGDILALANYPSFNPNRFSEHGSKNVGAKSLIETFEPGSTIKPFFIAEALNSGKYHPDTVIDTDPGFYYLQHHRIRDDANFGKITLSEILEKSSNVGVSKIAATLNKEKVYQLLRALGFGEPSHIDFPGINNGYLPALSSLSPFEWATLSFGYGMTTSALQLGYAYTIFANKGRLCPLNIEKKPHLKKCKQILPDDTAKQILKMLQMVVTAKGTGVLANIPGFAVAGKTGTTHRVAKGRFTDSYNAVFAGISPIENPQVVIVVWVENPKKNHYYQFGGVSAAPVFSDIAQSVLQYLSVNYQQPLQNYQLLNRDKAWLLSVIENN